VVEFSVGGTLLPTALGTPIFNAPYTAAANLYATNMVPKRSVCMVRVNCAFSASGILSLVRSMVVAGQTVTVTTAYNAGVALTSASEYVFDIYVSAGETLNWTYSVSGTTLKFTVTEIDSP